MVCGNEVVVRGEAPSIPATQQGPGSAAGTPKGRFILGIPPALLARMLLFQHHHLQLPPGVNACRLVEASKVWVRGVGAMPGALAGCHPQASLAPMPGTCSGRGEVLLPRLCGRSGSRDGTAESKTMNNSGRLHTSAITLGPGVQHPQTATGSCLAFLLLHPLPKAGRSGSARTCWDI